MRKLQQFIERNFYRFLLPCAKVYWFLFRPTTRGAKCLIVAEGKVLLIQNTYHRYGVWNLPGGRIAKDETPEEAVEREVREEVGLLLPSVHKLGEWFTAKEYKRDTVHYYVAEFPKLPKITIDPVEIAAAGWYPIDQLPERIYLSVTKALEMYNEVH
ncbi:MAG: hypothetical protein COV10_00625 [Candidatus Vogelbacteria bacterium CG10_big_fil_rev_8_21_14_0_10_51_16]|uniref:Nudix hydrolase domain-containing protein n=1 Tax=Candidatus Vogelbacteria bacterium CG10_big_fil_rev_8_21_14_0_10_51_16 TaxID=1975045 RepID=A0A2H0RFC8_9BACT|nr:MAG: hypothetical protein COV10_00625 [Candidatus Vogelbacteria bacterium CG10_big_fil_rev_8_21_14_0_10_51_16]